MAMTAPVPSPGPELQLTARQRGQAYNHSSLFADGGPQASSRYDQRVILSTVQGIESLKASAGKPPRSPNKLSVSPKVGCAGTPSDEGSASAASAASRKNSLSSNAASAASGAARSAGAAGAAGKPRGGARTPAAPPFEPRPCLNAAERKRLDQLSSVFDGTEQNGAAHSKRLPMKTPIILPPKPPAASTARDVHFTNKECSADNGMIPEGTTPLPPRPAKDLKEDSSIAERRRKNCYYSDLFGKPVSHDRQGNKHRGEVIGAANCSAFDTKSELGYRNASGWKNAEVSPGSGPGGLQKAQKNTSNMFGYQAPAAPSIDPALRQELAAEGAVWETKNGTGTWDIAGEVALRRRAKAHMNDFENATGESNFARKQKELSSSRVCSRWGVESPSRFGAHQGAPLTERLKPPSASLPPKPRAKRQAEMHSNIFRGNVETPKHETAEVPAS